MWAVFIFIFYFFNFPEDKKSGQESEFFALTPAAPEHQPEPREHCVWGFLPRM